MLSPRSESVPTDMADGGAEFCTIGSYRYCSPKNFPRTTVLQERQKAPGEPECNGSNDRKKTAGGGGRQRVRSWSMSVICNDPNFGLSDSSDCHTAPLMCLHEDGPPRSGEASACCQSHSHKRVSAPRRTPFRQFGNLFGCLLGGIRRDGEQKKAREKSESGNLGALALLELSRRQQSALAMKQGTIELLQGKLEHLQRLSSTTSALGSRHPLADFPEMQSPSKTYADEDGEKRGPLNRIICPQAESLPRIIKVESAELSAILHLFHMVAIEARLGVRYFCKVFMKQMEVSGYSVWRTLAEMEPDAKLQSKEHAAYILESRLNRALYHSFENDSFDDAGLTRIVDPEARCVVRLRDFQRLKQAEAGNAVNAQHQDFDREFWAFSERKMREMWFLFPWNMVFKGSFERSAFTAAFLDAAKCVWLLHRLAFSVHPSVSIVRVGKGMDADCKYVEQVAPLADGCRACDGPKVEFMTMPGFQIRKSIVKCQVYRHLQCKK